MLKQVNKLRARHGLRPLLRDAKLINGSRVHCQRQARRGGMWHQMDGYCRAECVAAGQQTPEAVVSAWYRSSGHKAILLGRYTCMGASVSNGHWTLRTR